LEVAGEPLGDVVWQMQCTIYGLKEAMADFDEHFEKVNVESLKMRRFRSDAAAYANDRSGLMVTKHVDDGMMLGTKRAVEAYEAELGEHFLLKTSPYLEGELEQEYLGRVIRRIPGGFGVRINPRLIEDVLTAMKLTGCKPTPTPGTKVEARKPDEEKLPEQQISEMRGHTGRLMFVGQERCDISFATKEVARGSAAPAANDLVRAKRVARYLAGTRNFENKVRPNKSEEWIVKGKVDSDWASDKVGRRSTSSGHIFVCDAAVGQYSRTQATPAISSAEGELYSIGTGAVECLYVKAILTEIPSPPSVEIVIASDSQAAISSQLRPGMGKMKHVELKYMFVQQLAKDGKVKLVKIAGAENSSDLGTKYLEKREFEKHRAAVGLLPMDEETAETNTVEMKTTGERSFAGGFQLLRSGFTTCLSGALLMLQVVPGKSDGSKQPAEASHTLIWVTVACLLGQLVLLASVFGAGFWLGQRCTKERKLNAVVIDEVKAEELTIEALKARLRQMQEPVSGLKAELVARYENAVNWQPGRKLLMTGAVASVRPRAGVQKG